MGACARGSWERGRRDGGLMAHGAGREMSEARALQSEDGWGGSNAGRVAVGSRRWRLSGRSRTSSGSSSEACLGVKRVTEERET